MSYLITESGRRNLPEAHKDPATKKARKQQIEVFARLNSLKAEAKALPIEDDSSNILKIHNELRELARVLKEWEGRLIKL